MPHTRAGQGGFTLIEIMVALGILGAALFILLLNPLVIYVTTVFGRKVKRLKARENSAYQLFQESLAETLDAIQQIRASNRERFYIRRTIGSAAKKTWRCCRKLQDLCLKVASRAN